MEAFDSKSDPGDRGFIHPGRSVMQQLQRCIDRTLDDLETSRVRNRTLSMPNARRVFERRWSSAMAANLTELEQQVSDAIREHGLRVLAERYWEVVGSATQPLASSSRLRNHTPG